MSWILNLSSILNAAFVEEAVPLGILVVHTLPKQTWNFKQSPQEITVRLKMARRGSVLVWGRYV